MVLMNRKGQSALEFLMTYGWAILVVLAAIGALAYFGVLNPSNFLPDQCIASTGFGCVGKPDIHVGYTQIIMVNGLGNSVYLDQLQTKVVASYPCVKQNVTFCDKGNAPCGIPNKTVENGQEFVMFINCSIPSTAAKYVVYINYTDSTTGFVQGMNVQINGKTKP